MSIKGMTKATKPDRDGTCLSCGKTGMTQVELVDHVCGYLVYTVSHPRRVHTVIYGNKSLARHAAATMSTSACSWSYSSLEGWELDVSSFTKEGL